jgi:hypothetical protein
VGNGGTGQTGIPINGQLLIGNGTGFNLARLTAGSNVTITNGTGTITIAASAATAGVSSITFAGTGLTPATATGGDVTVGGILQIDNGGTGETTPNGALTALLPPQSGQSGKYLTTNGSSASWGTIAGSGTVTSINVASNVTGFTFTGGPITTSGSITMTGTLAVSNGGTGQTTVGPAGTVLGSNGSGTTWLSVATLSGPNTWTGTQNFSGASVTLPSTFPTLSGPNTWTGTQSFSGASLTLPNGVVAPANLSAGAPSWTTSNIQIATGSQSVTLGQAGGINPVQSWGGITIGTNNVSQTGSFTTWGGATFHNVVELRPYFGLNPGITFYGTSGGGALGQIFADTVGGQRIFIGLNSTATVLELRPTTFTSTANDAFKPGGGPWSATSDAAVKKNVTPYLRGLTDIIQLEPVNYQYNGMFGTVQSDKIYTGFIAQDVQQTPFADMVGTYDYIDPETDATTQVLTVDTNQLIHALINAVKELKAQVDALTP